MELLAEQKRSSHLEASLTEPTNTNRWRQLVGSDPTIDEMVKKIEDIEVCLLFLFSALIIGLYSSISIISRICSLCSEACVQ